MPFSSLRLAPFRTFDNTVLVIVWGNRHSNIFWGDESKFFLEVTL